MPALSTEASGLLEVDAVESIARRNQTICGGAGRMTPTDAPNEDFSQSDNWRVRSETHLIEYLRNRFTNEELRRIRDLINRTDLGRDDDTD